MISLTGETTLNIYLINIHMSFFILEEISCAQVSYILVVSNQILISLPVQCIFLSNKITLFKSR